MITVTLNEDNSLNITGQMQVGEVVPNRCCQGFDWTVAHIFPNDEPEWTSLWGGCSNPDCPNYQKSIGPTDHMRGVSNVLVCDLAEWLFEKQDELTPNIVEPCTFCGRSGKECLCDDVSEW